MRRIAVGMVVGTMVALCAPAAAEAQPACGEVLKQDTTLTADLTCSGDGLVIGKSGITLDLGGYTLLVNSLRATGIANDGHNRVEVRNGTVKGSAGTKLVAFNHVSRSRVTGITLMNGSSPVFSWTGGARNEFSGNRVLGADAALSFTGLHRTGSLTTT